MATTTDPAEHPEARPFWKLNVDDKRILFITIVGGLVANIGLVLSVGLGLLIARLVARTHHAVEVFGLALLLPVLIYLGSAGVLAIIVVRETRTIQGSEDNPLLAISKLPSPLIRRPHVKATLSIFIGSLVIATLGLAITILALVGYAAGIK